MKRRRGFFFVDVVVGLTLLGVVAGLLAVALNRQQAAMVKLDNTRAATNLAQLAANQLQTGPMPATENRVKVRAISPVEIDQQLPPNKTWVQISATVGSQTEQLIALAPKESVK